MNRLHRHTYCAAIGILLSAPVAAQVAEAEQTEVVAAIAADYDGAIDDAESSIDAYDLERSLSISADVRVAFFGSAIEFLDQSASIDLLRSRWRLKATSNLTPYLRFSSRVAGLCSTEECSPNLTWETSTPTRNGMADGDITIDEAYFHWYRRERFDLALGRMQTRFVARGGVFARSLDRNDSNNTNVNWTDGVHATYRGGNGWNSHLVLQYNPADGPTSIRRGPLDFSDSAARISYFAGFENLQRTPWFLQRAVDITYMPSSLSVNGALDDYYAFVLRSANRWPERDEGIRVRVATELGYAPNTQSRASSGLTGGGDTSGLAWNVVVSLMDFSPNHSVGINYGEVGAGWLISPQFRNNESLAELRYLWRWSRNLAFDARIRHRKQLRRLMASDNLASENDFFLRFTWGGTIR